MLNKNGGKKMGKIISITSTTNATKPKQLGKGVCVIPSAIFQVNLVQVEENRAVRKAQAVQKVVV